MLRFKTACVLVVVLCGITTAQNARRTQSVKQTVHITPPKPGESRYYYFPFHVSPQTHRLTVRYEYDKADGTNVLDIGVFDSRADAHHTTTSGFRGWSGGRRSEFFISRDAATPGYIAGEMPAGTWQVILGLYKIAPGGVAVTFTIEIETDENKATTVASSTNPPPAGPAIKLSSRQQVAALETAAQKNSRRWLVGDLHMHTVHSDGDWTVSELLESASLAGLDFISVTDHNTKSHHVEVDQANQQLLVIRGEEITTYGGHANAWGLPSGTVVDFRVTPGDQASLDRVVSAAHASGALISINHPFASCGGCNWSYAPAARNFDAIEVWNGSWDVADHLAVKLWDQLLQAGRQITAIASSDSHRPAQPLGKPATHVQISGPLTQEAILSAIKHGNVYLTAIPKATLIFEATPVKARSSFHVGQTIPSLDSPIRFKVGIAGLNQSVVVNLVSAGQIVQTFQADGDEQKSFTVDVRERSYFRVEVRAPSGEMLALTNPIYVNRKR